MQAGLHVKAVATVDQAQGALAQGLPDCLVTGIETEDPSCALLVQDLRELGKAAAAPPA